MAEKAQSLRIVIDTIPHDKQRYETCGDWFVGMDGSWRINVSELPMKNALFPQKFAFLVAFHELVEMALCKAMGVTQERVDQFDLSYSGDREEPGDDERAPYHVQHQLATGLERTMAALLGVDWEEYEAAINDLGRKSDAED